MCDYAFRTANCIHRYQHRKQTKSTPYLAARVMIAYSDAGSTAIGNSRFLCSSLKRTVTLWPLSRDPQPKKLLLSGTPPPRGGITRFAQAAEAHDRILRSLVQEKGNSIVCYVSVFVYTSYLFKQNSLLRGLQLSVRINPYRSLQSKYLYKKHDKIFCLYTYYS